MVTLKDNASSVNYLVKLVKVPLLTVLLVFLVLPKRTGCARTIPTSVSNS
jgi:hypothetical protein